jgi:hypothetical protein
VGVTCQGATALADGFRAHAGNFFALAVVLVSGFSDGGLIPGCSHYALEVQCTSGAENAKVNVSCGLYDK